MFYVLITFSDYKLIKTGFPRCLLTDAEMTACCKFDVSIFVGMSVALKF